MSVTVSISCLFNQQEYVGEALLGGLPILLGPLILRSPTKYTMNLSQQYNNINELKIN